MRFPTKQYKDAIKDLSREELKKVCLVEAEKRTEAENTMSNIMGLLSKYYVPKPRKKTASRKKR